MVKRVLMIAYHYPPFRGGSGLQRTLSFSRYLPACGWAPVLLTANPIAYPNVGDGQLNDIPVTVPVKRAFALDTARHLSFRGHYLGWLALPDRWISWFLGAVPAGLGLVRKYKPRILWSTYPIATAHLVGLTLHRLTGIPWVADFRDPMTELDPVSKMRVPSDPNIWKARCWIERLTVKYSARTVFAAPGALRIYAERYPDVPRTRWAVIANGYDEEIFAAAERKCVERSSGGHRILLLHSGVLYPTPDRDPSAFFAALAQLCGEGKVSSANLKVVLRASGFEDRYRKLIRENGIEDLVFLEPAIPYQNALAEMLSADGLLIFQGYTSNPAIPAKLYEYLRARRPILAMVDSKGDTARTLQVSGVGKIVPLDSKELIAAGLLEFVNQIRGVSAQIANYDEIRSHSREFRTQELAKLLDAIDS